MANSGNSFIVTLQENIPLSEADKTSVEKMIKNEKGAFWFVVFFNLCSIIIIACVLLRNVEDQGNLVRKAILPIAIIIVSVLLFVGLLIWKQVANYQKDVREGKSVLTGNLVGKYSHYKSGSYFLFVEPPKQPVTKIGINKTDCIRYLEIKKGIDKTNHPRYKTIKIKLNGPEFSRYEIGAMLTVSFLPTNKVALKIVGQ